MTKKQLRFAKKSDLSIKQHELIFHLLLTHYFDNQIVNNNNLSYLRRSSTCRHSPAKRGWFSAWPWCSMPGSLFVRFRRKAYGCRLHMRFMSLAASYWSCRMAVLIYKTAYRSYVFLTCMPLSSFLLLNYSFVQSASYSIITCFDWEPTEHSYETLDRNSLSFRIFIPFYLSLNIIVLTQIYINPYLLSRYKYS